MQDHEREREAKAALERVRRDAETVGTSALARSAKDAGRRLGDHFAGRDAQEDGTDPAELWGRRVGRALSLIGAVVLTYLLGRQLGWW